MLRTTQPIFIVLSFAPKRRAHIVQYPWTKITVEADYALLDEHI